MGAGLIPFSFHSDQAFFLFQKTFSGRKEGYYIDFGGGMEPNEHPKTTAAREFVEETETLFLEDNLSLARRTPERIQTQTLKVLELLEHTLEYHPNWWTKRVRPANKAPKDWCSFFVEVPYRDLTPLNEAWENDQGERFKKRRELHWVRGDQLLAIYQNEPNLLWKRVRELKNGASIVKEIINARRI